jgi:hypothetical protein
MSQEIKKGMKTDYCPLMEIRVAIGKDNICVGCLPKSGVEGKMLALHGIVVRCTNGDGELVSKEEEKSLLNNMEGKKNSERLTYYVNWIE